LGRGVRGYLQQEACQDENIEKWAFGVAEPADRRTKSRQVAAFFGNLELRKSIKPAYLPRFHSGTAIALSIIDHAGNAAGEFGDDAPTSPWRRGFAFGGGPWNTWMRNGS
jgi:hypothetical protein